MATKTELSKDAQELEAYFARKNTRMAEAWRPEPGTTFRGEVIGLRMAGQEPPLGYGLYPVVVYRDLKDNSTKAVHAFHQTLRDKLAELKTEIGKVQWITYEGVRVTNATKDKDPKDQIRYHLYDVENDGEESAAVQEGFTF